MIARTEREILKTQPSRLSIREYMSGEWDMKDLQARLR